MFNTMIMPYWSSETMAQSEIQARNNFRYQFKKRSGRSAGAKVSLPGNIYIINTV